MGQLCCVGSISADPTELQEHLLCVTETTIDLVTAEASGASRSEPGDCDEDYCSSESDSWEGCHTDSRQYWMIPRVGVRIGCTAAGVLVCCISVILVFSAGLLSSSFLGRLVLRAGENE
jgi:hypothetical protein